MGVFNVSSILADLIAFIAIDKIFMKRSIWKGRYSKLENIEIKKVLKRTRIIEPRMINKSYSVHNGQDYKTIKITRDHVGHKIGEFFSSKKVCVYKKK